VSALTKPHVKTGSGAVRIPGRLLTTARQGLARNRSATPGDAQTIRRLVAELPEQFREAIVLREINDLPYRDIADVIGVPVGTVMSRLARARSMLRKAWIAEEGTST